MASADRQPQHAADFGWENTRAQTALATQIFDDEAQYLGDDRREIGRAVSQGDDRAEQQSDRELFVSCAPGEALQQQFEHLQPEFIAVHDIATRSSRQLVAGLAAASKRALQKLFIRRQGFGTVLATLRYVELPSADGSSVRIFSTDADAEPADRQSIARALLAFSRLGVMMVGEMPPALLDAQFTRWQSEVQRGAWPNRQLLLLPLAAANALATHGLALASSGPVQVRTTPKVTRATDAWGFIDSTWARLRGEPARNAEAHASAPPPARAAHPPAANFLPPLEMKPMPTVSRPSEAAAPNASDAPLQRYVVQIGELPGMVSCSVFDAGSGRQVMHAGADPWQVELARHGSELLAAISNTARDLGLGRALPDAAITLEGHHLLLRGVPKRPGLALHIVLDKTQGNLTLARLRLERLDEVMGG